jgi:hypothetical protein
MTKHVKRMLLLCLGLLCILSVQTVLAQAESGTCSALVQQALASLADNCDSLDRNNACYGFNRVNASFIDVMDDNFFSLPSDRANLVQLQSLTTAPLDDQLQHWGIAVLNVQANVPGTLPGQAVNFMLLGDVELENAVDPANAYEPVDPVMLTALMATALHSGPAANTNILATLASGEDVAVDGISPDGLWLRSPYQTGAAWVRAEHVTGSVDLSHLPVISENSQTPMQAFYFRTGFTDIECNEAPSLLAIQSPEGLTVDLTANGANFHIGSVIMLRVLPPGNQMQLLVIEGQVTLNPGTDQEVVVEAGHATQTCVDEQSGQTVEGCDWLLPVLLTEEEQALAQIVMTGFESFNAGQPEYVETDPAAPDAAPTADVTVIETVDCVMGEQISYTVEPGDTLFEIGLAYRTTPGAIIANNGLSGTTIFAGQTLNLICGDPGPTPIPVTPAPNTPGGANNPASCGNFGATSPLGGLGSGTTTFYWNPAEGATQYRITVIGPEGSASYTVEGSNTNFTAETNSDILGGGFYGFSWSVEALVNDQVLCSSTSGSMGREAPQPPAAAAPTLSPQQICEDQGGFWYEPYCYLPTPQ